MEIAILAFDGMTALDAVGPYEVLSRLPGARVRWVAAEAGPKRTDAGLAIIAEESLAEAAHPEILLLPGGPNVAPSMRDERVLNWIRAAHETSQWTTSVCTGSLILAAAGILRGLHATTHWSHLESLSDYGATPVRERVVRQGKVVTAAGVSAGIDMALALAALVAGERVAQSIQLVIEYDPQPPFDAGSPEKAPPEVVEQIRERIAARARVAPEES